MPLPTIPTPSHITKLPTNGRSVKYRPFLCKEYKNLMLAIEGEEKEEILNACMNIVDSCCEEVSSKSLSILDFVHLVLCIRSKSIGESGNIIVTCGNCETEFPITVDYTKTKLNGILPDNKIIIEGDVGVIMRPPSVDMFMEELADVSEERKEHLLCSCIESVFDENENHIVGKSTTLEEVKEFYGNLTYDQKKKLDKYFADLPKLTLKEEHTCPKCDNKIEMEVEDVFDFFT